MLFAPTEGLSAQPFRRFFDSIVHHIIISTLAHTRHTKGDLIAMFESGNILDVSEAERYVEELEKFSLEEVGSSRWMMQHERIEKLNLQAHISANSKHDEYVLEAISTFGKMETLIHDLLLIEIWKDSVYPLLVQDLAGRNSMRLYFILYHEATLINLFEVLLFHKYVIEGAGEKMLELVDYVGRKLARLNGGHDFRNIYEASTSTSAKDIADKLASRTPKEELQQHYDEIEFRVCVSACAVGRFICEHADILPLNVVSRITDTHDYLLSFVPLIENPPWIRRTSEGKWQKLVDFKWQEVPPIDLLKITKLEGQPWIALYHLMAKAVFRERYHLNSFRKGQILRVRKYLNEVLLDQLPFLTDIQRYMDELTITEVPEPSSMHDSVFMFQQVSVMREALLKNKNWSAVAQEQKDKVFTMTDRTDEDVRRMANLYADNDVEALTADDEDLIEINSQLR